MRRLTLILLAAGLGVLAAAMLLPRPGPVAAQAGGGYDVGLHTLMNSGGQSAVGGSYQVVATLAQGQVTTISTDGVSYTVIAGFWGSRGSDPTSLTVQSFGEAPRAPNPGVVALLLLLVGGGLFQWRYLIGTKWKKESGRQH